ncbi:hypothetical protein RF11_01665 [Thelohanellus kitauei]|uniref:Sortilin N-terminal domain-containing protein n=1 Tax=Thelohanellus kitauei TaxID=669202 RepID=A0A0C2IPU9_THEKT|nr:hypothetical protein RF11_01665 [Thelohanellus kitauei]
MNSVQIYPNKYNTDFIFLKQASNKGNDEIDEPFIFASNDGGRTFDINRFTVDGRPLHISRVIPTKDYMFCISDTNLTFVYIDINLKESHINTFEENAQVTPHPYFVNFVAKLVPEKNSEVCSD